MASSVALFVPCYVDQFFPHVAIAALTVLERLGIKADVPEGAACCGQPAANAGFAREGHSTIARFVDVYAPYERIIVLSGSRRTMPQFVPIHKSPSLPSRKVAAKSAPAGFPGRFSPADS